MATAAIPGTRRGYAVVEPGCCVWHCGNCGRVQSIPHKRRGDGHWAIMVDSWFVLHDVHSWRMTPFRDVGIVCPECCAAIWPHALHPDRVVTDGAGPGYGRGHKAPLVPGPLANPDSILRNRDAALRGAAASRANRARRKEQTPVCNPDRDKREKRVL